MHAVECASDKLALSTHAAILAATKTLPITLKTLNATLDVSAYDNPAVTKYKATLVTSSELETEAGTLDPSIMIVGKMYAFKEFLKDHFPEIRYTDLVFDGVTKAAWVLPLSAETKEKGTLARFLGTLGIET